jgi:arabinofuranan 3-O-arabinosyltransferase
LCRSRLKLRLALDLLREAPWVTRSSLMLWGLGLSAGSLTILAMYVVTHTAVGLTNGKGDVLGNDFVAFWSAVRLAVSGRAPLVYDPAWFQAFENAVTGSSANFRPYVYPPSALLLSLPLAPFSFLQGLVAWQLLAVGICAAVLQRLVGWRAAALAAIGAPAAFIDLLSWQNGHFTAALLGGGLIALERRPVLAGICFGTLAYKPQMALLVPVALAAGGRWRSFAAAALTTLLLALASLVLFGAASWSGFFALLDLRSRLLGFESGDWHRMLTVFVAARTVGAPTAAAYAAQLTSALAAAAVLVVGWRSPGSHGTKAAMLPLATFLATPYAWDYDTVVLIFAAAWLGREGLRTGFLAWERLAVVGVLALPLLTLAVVEATGVPLGPAILWLLLLLLLRRARANPAPAVAA